MLSEEQKVDGLGDLAADFALRMATVVADAAKGDPSPLVGLFCHKTSTDPEHTRFGWHFSFQAHVYAVIGETALMQFYDAIMGDPSDIKPVPVSELLSGAWRFYPNAEIWRDVASETHKLYWQCYRDEQDQRRAAEREARIKRATATGTASP